MTASSKSSSASSQSRGSYNVNARTSGIAAISIAGLLALGTGGYFANEWRVCRDLKDNYHNFAIGLMADQNLRSSVNSPELDKLLDAKTDRAVEQAALTLVELGDRCGQQAAGNAQARAQALILGIATD